jgi:hypothetical protein
MRNIKMDLENLFENEGWEKLPNNEKNKLKFQKVISGKMIRLDLRILDRGGISGSHSLIMLPENHFKKLEKELIHFQPNGYKLAGFSGDNGYSNYVALIHVIKDLDPILVKMHIRAFEEKIKELHEKMGNAVLKVFLEWLEENNKRLKVT